MSVSLWDSVTLQLKSSLEPEEYRLWIDPLKPMEDQHDRLVLICPDDFHRRWVKENYLPRLKRLVRERVQGLEIALSAMTDPRPKSPPHRQMNLPAMAHDRPMLNQGFVFNRFVTGSSNEFAFAAAKSLARDMKVFANTLFLFSGTGLGKSHLTQAVGNLVMEKTPQSRVAYLTAEDFTNQMISGLRRKRIEEFKDRFRRHCDLLLLEEVQFLSGKEKTQIELSYTLDALLNEGKRVIFTGSCLPHEVKGLNKNLESRLSAGITAPIEPPDPETRRMIIASMAREEGVEVDQEVMEYLADQISGDVRRLQSALVGLLAKSSLTGRRLNLNLAAEVLAGIKVVKRRVTPENILNLVAKAYDLDKSVLTSKTRKKDIVRPRNLAMFVCRRHTMASYATIGKIFNRDHATVMYGVDQIERKLAHDTKLHQELAYIEERVSIEQS